jgi:hypothetical protein
VLDRLPLKLIPVFRSEPFGSPGFPRGNTLSPACQPTKEEATGPGETSITIIAAAVGNAIFDATGVRIRQIPFTAERVKAALAARG